MSSHNYGTDNSIDVAGSPHFVATAARAYEKYLAGGSEGGHDVEHWLSAERELASEASAGPTDAPRR